MRCRKNPALYMTDISTMPEIMDAINGIINNRGIAEVKIEGRSDNIVVVEIKRTVKTKPKKR